MANKKKKNVVVSDTESALGLVLNENLQAEVQNVLNKNVITDEDIEKYNMSKNAAVSVDDFIGLMNKAFDTDVNAEEIATEVISENNSK